MVQEPQADWRRDADASSDAPRRMDAAVRAALKARPAERRSFRNEDDMEGPRIDRGPRSKLERKDPS